MRTRGAANRYRSDVAAVVERYPTGQAVAVYYDPANPSDAYLEAGVDYVNYIMIIAPLGFAAAGGGYLVERLLMKRVGRSTDDAGPESAAASQ